MRQRNRSCFVGVAVAVLAIWSMGCRTSSHTTVRISEYQEVEPPEVQTDEGQSTEWEMVSPGEMQSPGTMIFDPQDPK